MSLNQFMDAPWKTSHSTYDSSWLNMRPAPEFATGEVLLASTYRAVGFEGHPESEVPKAGRNFDRSSSKPKKSSQSHVSVDTWRTILHGALQSPKQPKQSAKRFLQLCPLVPDVALYSNSARLAGNSWNPGQLVERMITMGSGDATTASKAWESLFVALSVDEQDDIWARWLQDEFVRRSVAKVTWKRTSLTLRPVFSWTELQRFHVPARQLVEDLGSVIAAKGEMTRRQWVSIMEAVLRVGAVAHTLWLCEINERVAELAAEVIAGGSAATREEVEERIFRASDHPVIYGMPALPAIRDRASKYLSARLYLNLVLWHLEASGSRVPALNSPADLHTFLEVLSRSRKALAAETLTAEFQALSDRFSRDLLCRRGIGSNISEFCRHALGQRQTADDSLRGYDQGYSLRKKAEYASAPWVVALGPVALLAFAHCCLAEAAGPRSVGRLAEHLSSYGISVALDDIVGNQLGSELRTLGLVLDSPDAESGMLLVPPFGRSRPDGGAA